MIAYTYIEKGKFALVLRLIEAGKIDTTPLITHYFPMQHVELFNYENLTLKTVENLFLLVSR